MLMNDWINVMKYKMKVKVKQ